MLAENFQAHWQIRIYNTSGNLVDIPQADIESVDLEDTLNGGSATATIVFARSFDNIGAIANRYTVLVWFWPPGQTQPLDPYYGGHIVDYDQAQRSASGRVTAKIEGDAKLLDAAIVTEQLNPGVNGNPNMDAGVYVEHLLSTYQPPNFVAPSIPGTTFNMFPTNFDASKLGAAIDTVLKQGRDLSGNIWTWFVRTRHDLTRQVVVQVDQNPNSVSGPLFKLLFLESQLDQYKIQNLYRNIVNVVAVYGGKDPQTGLQVFGDYQDATSVAEFTAIEDKISVPALTTVAGCQAYATTWLTLHAYPQAQGSARLLQPDPTILGGSWVQVMETPATASAPAVIKQVRVASVKVTIAKNRIEQVISTSSPVPYLDDAVYRLGQHVQVQQAIANSPVPANRQTLFVRAGGTVSATGSSPAQIALTACEAVFPAVGVVYAAALPLTTLTDDSGGPNNGQTGDGAYTISVTSGGAYVVTKGARPANTPTQQNLVAATVIAGVPWPSDIRTLQGQPGFSTLLSAPALATGTIVSIPTPPNAGSGAYDQPVTFSLVAPTWTNADAAFSYLEMGAVPHGAATAVATYTTLQPTSSGAYDGTVPGLGAGTAYDLYVRAHDQLDRPTPWLFLGTTLQNTVAVPPGSVGAPSLQAMPSAIKTNGPAISSATYSARTLGIGMVQMLTATFTETDFTTVPPWCAKITMVARLTGTSNVTFERSISPGSSATGTYSSTPFPVLAGDEVDLGLYYSDLAGNVSATVWPAGWGAITDPYGAYWDSGNSYKTPLHTRMSGGVQTAINASGQSLLVEFPGGVIGSDGALTNVDGVTSTQAYPLPAGTTIEISAQIAKNTTTDGAYILVGNVTNGYGLINVSGTSLELGKFVSGVFTAIGTSTTIPSDTNYHTLLLTLTVVSSTEVQIQGTWDGVDPNAGVYVTDSSLNLTTGTWPITLYTGGNAGKVLHLNASTALHHFLAAPRQILNTISSDPTKTGLDGVIEGTTYNRVKATEITTGFVKQLNDGTNVRTAGAIAANMNASGQSLLVEFPGGVIGRDGALTNVDGVTSTQAYPLPAGTTIEISAQIAKNTTTDGAYILVGNVTNGYGLINVSGTSLELGKFVSGVFTAIGTSTTIPSDTNYHTLLLTLTVVSSTEVQIQGTWDGVDPNAGVYVTDSSLNLTTGTWPITLYTGGNAGKVLHLNASTALHHYLAQTPEYLANFTSGGLAKSTTMFNGLAVAINNTSGNPGYSYTSTTTSIDFTIPATTYTRSDGSTVSVAQATPSFSGLTASTGYFFDLWYDVGSNTFGAAKYTSAPSAATVLADCYSQGRIVVAAKVYVVTPSSGTGSGSGSPGAGGCPATYQEILTHEHGLIRADELAVGMHVSHGDGWVRVVALERRAAPLWRYTVREPDGIKSYDVNDTHASFGADREWVLVTDMRPGSSLYGGIEVIDSRYIGDGDYIALEVEGHVYSLGKALVHNISL